MKMNELNEFLGSSFDGFEVHLDPASERADIVLNRPPLNVIEMGQRDELRSVFEALDQLPEIRVIVLRSVGEHFSSGGNIRGFWKLRQNTCRNWRITWQRLPAVQSR